MFSLDHDLNAESSTKRLLAGQVVADGDTNGDEIVGETIDRRLGGGIFMGAIVAVSTVATLGEAETLALGLTLQDSDDGSVWSTPETLLAEGIISTGDTGGSTEKSLTKVALNLASRKRYFRVNGTPELSETGEGADDTAAVIGHVFMMGGQKLPTS